MNRLREEFGISDGPEVCSREQDEKLAGKQDTSGCKAESTSRNLSGYHDYQQLNSTRNCVDSEKLNTCRTEENDGLYLETSMFLDAIGALVKLSQYV